MLLPHATRLAEADALARQRITPELLNRIVDLVPYDWTLWPGSELTPDEVRAVYKRFLHLRLQRSTTLTTEAEHARHATV